MADEEQASIIKIIRNSSIQELVLLSIVLIPTLCGSWIALISSIVPETQPESATIKAVVLIVVSLLYFLGLGIMKYGEKSEQTLERARIQLRNRLLSRANKTASIEAIVTHARGLLTPEMIENILSKYLQEFKATSVVPNRPAVKLLLVEEEEA
ncbi:MAG: hypothetical protein KIS92_24060 [Planctomycetota bacterium]|nr:hypothetical protein [Planctomycetota bacterium]